MMSYFMISRDVAHVAHVKIPPPATPHSPHPYIYLTCKVALFVFGLQIFFPGLLTIGVGVGPLIFSLFFAPPKNTPPTPPRGGCKFAHFVHTRTPPAGGGQK